jgi:hypothetical protein
VGKALRAAKRVYWFTRPSSRGTLSEEQYLAERFRQAFPAGDRNEWIKQQKRVFWMVDAVKTSKLVDGKLTVEFKDAKCTLSVDQYVAAIGAAESASYLGDLLDRLEPIIDRDGHVHPDGDAVLAYKGTDSDLWIVGAGVFKVADRRLDSPSAKPKLYTRSNEYLPTAARPPEGVPTIIASMAALTRYLPGGRARHADPNLGNFTDTDRYFKQALAESLAVVVGAQVVEHYGLELVARFMTDNFIGNRIMKSSPYGVTLEELETLYANILERGPAELQTMLEAWCSSHVS